MGNKGNRKSASRERVARARVRAWAQTSARMCMRNNEGRNEVMNEGRKEGRNEVMNEGRKEGRKEGRREGRKEGRQEGRKE